MTSVVEDFALVHVNQSFLKGQLLVFLADRSFNLQRIVRTGGRVTWTATSGLQAESARTTRTGCLCSAQSLAGEYRAALVASSGRTQK